MTLTIRLGVIAAALTLSGLSASADQTYGKGVKVAEATSIKSLYESPDKFLGKTIRVDGVVTAVCEEMGCWLALADSADPKHSVRIKVDHKLKIVFPMSARGKMASAEGVLEKVPADDTEAMDAAKEQAAGDAAILKFNRTYQLQTTGAVVK